ncbi:glucosamine 6-phosphate N-acetyltransferase [Tanacetum coccineum]
MELLQQLTVCDPLSDEVFQKRFEEFKSYGDDHIICVIEDVSRSKIVATGSVFIEKKFVRSCGKAGHIEDVVVDSSARGMQLGKKVIGFLADHARSMGCYKVILDCSADEVFQKRFEEFKSYGDDHIICVIEDVSRSKIVATGSVFIEKKFVRSCGKAGHIEDVVVDSSARGMQLGKKVIGFLADHARSMGCYKVILDCSAGNKAFYGKCRFKEKEIQMVKYFV